MRTLVLFLFVMPLIAGCDGSEATESSSSVRRPADPATTHAATTAPPDSITEPDKIAASLTLEQWSRELVPLLLAMRDRTRAFEAGDQAKVTSLDHRIDRRLRGVRKFGAQGRAAFVDTEPSRVTRAVKAAGDAWTRWAYELQVHPPLGDFTKARGIADLAAIGVRRVRRAYRLTGEPIPAMWRRG